MTRVKSLVVTGILVLSSASALAALLSSEIYRPAGAYIIKTDHQGNGEFEYEAGLSARHTSIPTLAREVTAHAHSKSLRVVESEIKRNDTDLKFRRGRQELDVSTESKDHGRIRYKVGLDSNR